MRRFPIIPGILLIMIAAVPSPGDDGFTLEQAVTVALKNNPRVLSALKEAEASLGRRLQLEAIPDPEVLFSDEGLGLGRRSKVEGEKEISFGIQQSARISRKAGASKPGGKIRRAHCPARGRKGQARRGGRGQAGLLQDRPELQDGLLPGRDARPSRPVHRDGGRPVPGRRRPLPRRPPGPGRESAGAGEKNEVLEARNELRTDKVRLNILMGRRGDDPLELMTGLAFVPPVEDLAAVREEALRTRPSLKIAGLKLERATPA